MGHEIITYQERRSILHDLDLWAVRHFLLKQAEVSSLTDLATFIRGWDWIGPGVYQGIEFDRYFGGVSKREADFLSLLEATRHRIKSFGQFIPVDYLATNINTRPVYDTESVLVERLVTQLQKLSALFASPQPVYHSIAPVTDAEVEAALERNDPDELLLVAIAVGLHSADLQRAEAVCLRLASHPHFNVRGNAILSLGHLARRFRSLTLPESVEAIRSGIAEADSYVRGQALTAADDVEWFAKMAVEDPKRTTRIQRLGKAMSEVSGACFAAGWHPGTEEHLPRLCQLAVASGRPQPWGTGEVTVENATVLTDLATDAGTWATRDEEGVGYVAHLPQCMMVPNGSERKDHVTIELGRVTSIAELHDRLSQSLGFPDFYGKNWDAFWDAINGLVAMPRKLTLTGWLNIESKLPEAARMVREILGRLNEEFPLQACVVEFIS